MANHIEGFQIKYISRTKWRNSLYFFTCWYQNIRVDRKILGWVWSEMVVVHWSQGEWVNEWMNWADFLNTDAIYKFTKVKNYFNNFSVVVVKNVHTTLISKCMNEPGWFFACYTYLRELKVIYFNSYWTSMVKYWVSF